MVQAGVYDENFKLIDTSLTNTMSDFDLDRMEFVWSPITGILKQVDNLTESTFVKRIIIKDEGGVERVIIGNLDV